MNCHEFVLVGEAIEPIDSVKHEAFILNLQTGILAAIVEKGLLTLAQAQLCVEQLERQAGQVNRGRLTGNKGEYDGDI